MRGTDEVRTAQSSDAAVTGAQNAGALPMAGRRVSPWLVLLGLAAITLVAYSPVLFNFFAGDDFVHLTWLKDAVVSPELIWRNFHSSWLDGTTTKFYRPLISVFMVSDYMIWKTNALGFHLTNLFFHITGSFFLFLVMQELCAKLRNPARWLWPITSAGIFALYPLHPEAVSWITGRVDSIVTAFCLPAIWCYMRRHAAAVAHPKIYSAAAIACFVLGLLSKEMAITVPAVLVAWELARRTSVKKIVVNTGSFWLVLAGYFAVRRLALGTFVGGYDDSLLFIADIKAFLLGWLHAARMTLVPINRDLIGAHSVWTKLWEIFLLATGFLGAASLQRNKDTRPVILFLTMWLVLCLIPVYKIFAIADDLQGSRLAYLSTVPLSGLLACGISTIGKTSLRVIAAVLLGILSGSLLWINNQPWRQAGMESNALRASLSDVYASVDNDPQTLLIGLPDQIHGAYVSRNALWGMLKRPQFSKDVQNCLMINGFDPIQPFGHLKDSLAANENQIKIFRWDANAHKLLPVILDSSADQPLSQPQPLPEIATGVSTADRRPYILFETSEIPCWKLDFVKLDLHVTQPGNAPVGADLLFANSLTPEFLLCNRTHARLTASAGNQSLIFSLRGLSEWAFGSGTARLKLLLPPGCHATVTAATVIPPAVLMPRLGFANDGYLGTKGYLHVGQSQPHQKLNVDARNISGAVATELEISRANLQFEEQNCSVVSKRCGKMLSGPIKGSIEIEAAQFHSPGLYQARLWAKDASGKNIGVCSDHVNIAVD